VKQEPLGKNSRILRKLGKLDKSEERLNVTLRSIGDAVIATGTQGEVTLMNPVAEQLTGWSEAEAAGKPLDEVFHIINEETRRQVENPVTRVMREGMVVGLANHTLLIARDGTERPIADSGAPIRDAKGEVAGVVLVFRDRTEERAAQRALRESEERFRTIFDQASVSIWEEDFSELIRALDDLRDQGITDFRAYFDAHPEFVEQAVGMVKILDVNDETVRMLEADSKEDLLGSLHKTFTPESLTAFRNELLAIAKGQSRFEQPAIIQTLRGRRLHILLRLTTLEGRPRLHRALVSLMDITERVRAEEALRESEERYRGLYNSIRDAILVADTHRNIIDCNLAFTSLFGYTLDDLQGQRTVYVYENEEEFHELGKALKEHYGDGPFLKTVNYRKKTGEVFPGETGVFYLKDDKGEVTGFIGLIRDITERVQAEEQLRHTMEQLDASEKRLKTIIETEPECVKILAPDGVLLDMNRAGLDMIEAESLEQVRGQSVLPMVAPEYRRAFRAMLDSVMHGHAEILVFEIIGLKGTRRWLETHSVPLYDAENKTTGLLGVTRDITGRMQTEQALRESEQRYHSLFEHSSDAVFVHDLEGNITDVNQRALALFGYSKQEFLQVRVMELHPESALEASRSAFETISKTGTANFAIDFKRKNGEVFPAEVSSTILELSGEKVVLGIVRDITERVRTEEALRNAQKLESLGILAGGIAHDFNNVLTAVLGNIGLAKMRMKEEEPAYRNLILAEKASLRARELTQQLLTFSEGGAPIRKTASIAELIVDSCEFATRGSPVRTEFSIADDLWVVDIDEGQMSQVIHNLVINAVQAMPGGGTIQIGAENVVLEEEALVPPLSPGRYVHISVADEGIGIPEEYLSKIFDPYFTTKQQGSGLGLATSYAIVQKHEGLITVESKLGVGTTFHITLPASQKEAQGKLSVGEAIPSGQGRVLVMDDEEIVRAVAGDMLKHLGYVAESARDGDEALAMYRRAQDAGRPYDAVIMDLTIPGGMGGKEAIRRLLGIDPGAKVIVSSGYSNDPVMANFTEYGFRGVVSKPYRLKELGATLRDVIGN